MTSFDKLVDSVDNSVFNTVSEYLEDVMGEAGHEYNTLLQEKVLVALLKKYRPENVIFVEEEEVNTPKLFIYGVYDTFGNWMHDVSGIDEGELYTDVVESMNTYEEEVLMDDEFNIGDDVIGFECCRQKYSLKKK